MNILITGGAGFIGSELIRYLIEHTPYHIINLDKLTYAANINNLASVSGCPRYTFYQQDITQASAVRDILARHLPFAIIHLAAESHVDRSIFNAENFIQSNIVGTYTLLETARHYWQTLPENAQQRFRFLHISTDEVYGDLGSLKTIFNEHTAYAPNNPYSASKAASDHLVRAWQKTYQLPTIITHSTNNFGAYQHPEKLIPKTIIHAISGQTIPIYGSGLHIRDWMHVSDHVRALHAVLERGQIGETYLIGARNPQTNLHIAHTICEQLETLAPNKPPNIKHYRDLIAHVADRKGHDSHYELDNSKIHQQLHWRAQKNFDAALKETVLWYLNHKTWWENIQAA